MANLAFVDLQISSYANQTRAASALEANSLQTPWQAARILTTRLLEAIVENHVADIAQLILIVAFIALGVGATGVASSLSVSVVERQREIGVLKAIGGRSSTVAVLFASEAALIAALAWLVALLSAPLLSRGIADAFGAVIIQYPFEYRAAPWAATLAIALALAVALLSSVLPVRRAIRTTTHQALRAP
ncbi:MAG: FtsX-like permease family protein [Gammaproteobacteria bacterium]|nr:FtsX-like permease family protein [Gammaproteobacteria bacterium]